MARSKIRNVKAEAPVSKAVPQDTAIATKVPGGKLGLIVERLATEQGATAEELAAATGWQKHSVLGALSRLRSQGFAMQLGSEGGRKAYRLEKAEG